MLISIEIQFTTRNARGDDVTRRAIVKDISRLKAIRVPRPFNVERRRPSEELVEIAPLTEGDIIGDNDDGPQVCYDLDTGTFCW